MEDERVLAKRDYVLNKLASSSEFIGDVYSSDDEFDFPYELNDASDDIDEIVFREQIKGAKKFFEEVTEIDDDDDDDDLLDELVDEFIDDSDVTLNPSVKYTDALSYFEKAIQRNSKMRDELIIFKQNLLKKKQEYEDMICLLESKIDEGPSETAVVEEEDEVISWDFPGYLPGLVFTNKISIFFCQFSYPYFKDKSKFHCPLNQDTLNLDNKSAISVSHIKPSLHWFPQSIHHLEYAIKKSLINEFKSRADFKAIFQWREYSAYVKNHSLTEILSSKPPDFELDWLNISTLFPHGNRTYTECMKLWNLYLTPKFSKEEWTASENDKIIALAKKYDEQDWDKIAEELGTSRSPFQLFSYYQSGLRNRVYFGEKWTPKEDAFLKEVVKCCTYGDFISWKKVVYYFETRHYIQIYNRWKNNLSAKKKGKFSLKEDKALITAMSHGMGYKDTVEALRGQRNEQQVRERLKGIVKFGGKNALNIGDWSESEDAKLLELIKKYGSNYAAIAKEMGTRDRTQCRHRCVRLKKYFENPDFNIQSLERKRKRSDYSSKIRHRKKRLMKLLSTKPLSQTRKRKFIEEVNSILEEEDDSEEFIMPVVSQKYKPYVKYLLDHGSGYWTAYDQAQTNDTETQLTIHCCNILNGKFNYDLWDDDDEHLNPVKEIFDSMKENGICDSTLNPTSSPVDEPSTSSSSSSSDIVSLIPPNRYTCSGFLNYLSFCDGKQKLIKTKAANKFEVCGNERVEEAKKMFQQRLLQLFLWPSMLSDKDSVNKFKTYMNKAV